MILSSQQTPFLFVLLLFSIALPLHYRPKIGNVNAFAWCWFLCWCVLWCYWPNFEMKIPVKAMYYYNRLNAVKLHTLLVIVPLILLWFKRDDGKVITFVFNILSIGFTIDLTYMFVMKCLGTPEPHGLMNAHTFDTGMAALMAAHLMTHKLKVVRYLSVIYVGLIVYIGGDTALVCMFGGFFMFWLSTYYRLNKTTKIAALIALLITGAASLIYFLPSVINTEERMVIWRHHIQPMLNSEKLYIWGHGPGSFEGVGLASTPINGMRTIILHNDFLQVFFEFGIVSTLIFIVFAFYNLFRLIRYPMLFSTGCMFMFGMVVYFPLHFLHPLIVGLLLVRANAQRRHAWFKDVR